MLGPTVYILQAKTPAAEAWLDDNVPDATYAMGGVVVEHRYMPDLWAGIKDASLETEFEVVS
jgi:hypothetical protein